MTGEMSNECWSYGPESDWCGEHDSELNVPDPNDPELWVCQFVAHNMARAERKQVADYLRAMACAAGEPWTGDSPHEDHGHTTCWHLHRAADWLDPRAPGVLYAPADVTDEALAALKERWGDGGARPTEASDW